MSDEKGNNVVLQTFETLAEETARANDMAQEDLNRRKDDKRENVWYGFALAITKSGKCHMDDIPVIADELLKAFDQRFTIK